jgi:hypothetical protein
MGSIQDEIDALFSWNPPPLRKPEADKTLSASTRPPAFYDKHFSDQLVLCQIKRLPSLVPDLAANLFYADSRPLFPGHIISIRLTLA